LATSNDLRLARRFDKPFTAQSKLKLAPLKGGVTQNEGGTLFAHLLL